MPNIVIKSGSLRMGGLERVLIEVLQNIDTNKYNITLLIDDDSGEKNIFEKDIPKNIPYYFLKDNDFMKKMDYHRENKKKLYNKIIYNYLMYKEKDVILQNFKKIQNKIGDIDILIDFDAGASKYIEEIEAKKKVCWIHNSIPKLKKKPSKIARFGKRLEKYDKVVAICDEMKDELQEIYPNIKDKITRIYNPFNFERIEKLKNDISELNDKQKEMLKDDYIVAVSRLDTIQKDYKTLLLAMKNMQNKNIKLYIVGDGVSRDEINNMIKEYNLTKRVFLLGRFKNPYVWMNNANFFVHSSKYEGFGLVLVEAGYLEKSVIASSCKVGPTEVLDYGNAGILFDVGDTNKLTSSMDIILSDEKLRNEKILNMNNRIQEFSSQKVLKEYEKLIDSLL